MKTLLTILACTLLLAPLAVAQQPAPAPQLAKLEKTLGTWEGKGVFRAAPDAEPMEWTGVSTTTKILNGHFLQEDMRVEAGMPAPMVWRTIYGWDTATESYKFFSVTNMGGVHDGTTHWVGGGQFVSSGTMMEEGQVVTDRNLVNFQGDTYTIRIDRAVGGGEFFTHVEGTFKKGGSPFVAIPASSKSASQDAAMMPTPKQLKALSAMEGDWSFKGKMSPAPGAPMIEVKGKEEVRYILGGQALFWDIMGEPTPEFPMSFHGNYYQGWDANSHKLRGVWISNMGEFMTDETYVMDDGVIVSLNVGMVQGMPRASRGITAPDGAGGFTMTGWDFIGDGKPEKTFEGKMTKMK